MESLLEMEMGFWFWMVLDGYVLLSNIDRFMWQRDSMQRNKGQNLDTETRSRDFLDAVTQTTISQVPTDVSVGPT